MKKMIVGGVLAGVLGLSALTLSFAEESSLRAIFMSPAGSVIKTEEQKQPEKQEVSKTEKVVKKTTAKKSNSDNYKIVNAGLSVEVVKVEDDGRAFNVDPKKYVFKDGDKFIVKFQTNLPGYVEVYNINSMNKINKLGVYQVEPFTYVQLPPNGEFQFTGTKGDEKLVLTFYPCNTKSKSTQVATRDIVISQTTSNVNYSQLNDTVPSCKVSEDQVEYKINNKIQKYASRDIITTNKIQNSNYAYEDGAVYSIEKIDNKNIKPIITVIEFKHK